mmetsp:Transcript_52489/g.139270  ORF Transcript_52489/g.139270 Transcript_52489/m.139270 type:complete len:208 (+) Transcript_52489:2377-3000(+)
MHSVRAQFTLSTISVLRSGIFADELLGLVGNAKQILALAWVGFHARLRVAHDVVGEADGFVAILESRIWIVIKARELEGHSHVGRDQKIGVPRAGRIVSDNLSIISHTPVWAHRLSPCSSAVATSYDAFRPSVDPVDNRSVRPLRDILGAGNVFEHHLTKRGLGDPSGLARNVHFCSAQEEQLISSSDVGHKSDEQAHEYDHANGLH